MRLIVLPTVEKNALPGRESPKSALMGWPLRRCDGCLGFLLFGSQRHPVQPLLPEVYIPVSGTMIAVVVDQSIGEENF